MLGWTHFLAFDLFTGAWEVEDAGRIGVPHWAVIVPLVLTFLFGPIGLLTYGAIRTAHLLRTKGRPCSDGLKLRAALRQGRSGAGA